MGWGDLKSIWSEKTRHRRSWQMEAEPVSETGFLSYLMWNKYRLKLGFSIPPWVDHKTSLLVRKSDRLQRAKLRAVSLFGGCKELKSMRSEKRRHVRSYQTEPRPVSETGFLRYLFGNGWVS